MDQPTRKRLAAQLRQTRLERKLTLHKLSKQLRLPESTLKALERANDTTIPPSHWPGLVRRYGEALGLSASTIDELLSELVPPTNSGPGRRRKSVSTPRTFVLSRVSLMAAGAAVVTVVVGYALWQVYGLASAPRLQLTQPAQDTVVTHAAVTVAGVAATDASVLVNGDTVPLSENGEFSVKVYLQPGRNSLEIRAINSFGRQATVNRVLYFQANSNATIID